MLYSITDILKRETIQDSCIKLQKLHIQENNKQYNYDFIEKGVASIVLVVDHLKQEVILVKQVRPFDYRIKFII